MEEKNFVGKLHFSFTNDLETTTLDRVYNEEPEDFDTITWFLEEFKYFLKAMSFPERMTDRIVYLEDGEKVIDKNGNVVAEYKALS
jgi:hypothetical protein